MEIRSIECLFSSHLRKGACEQVAGEGISGRLWARIKTRGKCLAKVKLIVKMLLLTIETLHSRGQEVGFWH